MAFAKLSAALLACNDARPQTMASPEPPRARGITAPETHKHLARHFKALKLPAFLREYEGLARQCAVDGLDYAGFLLRLTDHEVTERQRRLIERRVRDAQFPTLKRLGEFDFDA